MSADRNLLYGMLALHNGLVTRDQLIEAMTAWMAKKETPLGDILRGRGALTEDDLGLLEALVARQIQQHGDAAKSLQALEVSSSARRVFTALPDPDVQASVAHLATPSAEATTDHVARPGEGGPRYRVLRPHARGGLGEVFVAEDTELHREVALKEIQQQHAKDSNSRGRFLLEAEITGRLEHPGIVPVYGLGCYDDGRPYYAMRFIKGDNLKHAIDRFHQSKQGFDTLAFRAVLRRFLDVCNAVAYAHARGVLHRDIKPGNVMLGEYGETLVVDWGLAKVVGRSEPSAETTMVLSSGSSVVETVAGTAIGTPAYMSPEQAEGKLDALGPATDVYSLGATLYYLLTKRSPVSGDDMAAVLEKVRRGDIPPAEQARADVPRPLAAICRKAMARTAADRYPSVLALAADVEHWLADEPVSAHRDPALVRFARWRRKNRTLVTTASAVLLVALVASAVGLAVVGGLNQKLEAANSRLTDSIEKLDDSNAKLTASLAETKKEREIAVAVNDFLQRDLLGQADIGNQVLGSAKEERNPNITVAELLGKAAKNIEGKFQGQEETEAAIRRTIGNTYKALGKYELALPQLERSVLLFMQKLGSDHPGTLTSKNDLALLYYAQGKYDKAEPLFLEVIPRFEQKWGADHPDTLISKNNLALLYHSQAKYDKAEPIFLEVIPQQEKKLGSDHPNTLISKSNLALLYYAQGKYDKAEPLFLEVIPQKEEKLGIDHPHTLGSKNNLAVLYCARAKYDKAEPILLEVIPQREKKLGADHPDTLISKSTLASLYRARGKYDKAEPLLMEVIPQFEKKLGADHLDTVISKNNLALLYHAQAKYDKAGPLLMEVIPQFEKKLGAGHNTTLQSKNTLAGLYRAQRKYDKAEPLFLEVFQQWEKGLGADHPRTLGSKNSLAALYWSMKKLDRSIALFEQLVPQVEKKRGAEHIQTLTTLANLGVNYRDAGRLSEAVHCLEDALARAAKRPDGFPASLTWVRGELLTAYEATKQFAKAEPYYRAALELAGKQFGPDDVRTAGAMAQLGTNLLLQKKSADAEKLLRDCLRLREKAQPDEWTTFNTKSLLGESLLGQKKHADAEPLLVQGYEGMKQRQDKIPPPVRTVRLKESLERLVALYDATGNKDEAARYRKELDALPKPAKEPAKK